MQTQSLINKPCTIEHQTIGTFECIPLEINNRDTIVKIIDPTRFIPCRITQPSRDRS